jgi:hypothetical protein
MYSSRLNIRQMLQIKYPNVIFELFIAVLRMKTSMGVCILANCNTRPSL